MASSIRPTAQKPRRVRHWILLGIVGILFFVLIGLVRLFLLDGDARTLRDGLSEPAGASLKTKMQLSLGPLSAGLARICVGRVCGLSDEQRQLLSSVRRLSVGIYDIPGGSDAERRSFFKLAELDGRMRARGWVRLLAVRERHECVLVYVPKEDSDAFDTRICLAVIDGRNLIVASARTDLEPLVAFVREHKDELFGCGRLAGFL